MPNTQVLTLGEVRATFEQRIKKWQDLYSLDFDQMVLVARYFKYSEAQLPVWFDQQDTLKFTIGLEFDPGLKVITPEDATLCPICFDPLDNFAFALVCGHTFCRDCWQHHLRSSIDPQSKINACEANCAQDGCNVMMTHQGFLHLLSDDLVWQNTYWTNLVRQFSESDKSFRWCARKDCEHCFYVKTLSE